jgi:hypothetical protein
LNYLKYLIATSLILIFLIFSSCSIKELPPLDLSAYESFQNTLVRNGGSISTPENFIYFLNKNESKTMITHFKGSGIDGIFEKLKYRYAMSNEKLTHYYIERILAGAKDITIRKSADKKDIFIVTAISKDRKKEIVTALYLKNSKILYLLQLTSKTGVLFKNRRVSNGIISSMKSADIKISLRKKENFISFLCPDSSFIWYEDLKEVNGFKLFGRENKFRITISNKRYENFDQIVSEYSKKFLINTFVTSFKDDRNKSKVLLIKNYSKNYSAFVFMKKSYVFKIKYKKSSHHKAENVVRSDFFIKLFSYIQF